MAEDPDRVALPERLDRRMRLGPFPSARDALKFVTYAAVGAVLLPVGGAIAWLPVVAGAFAISVWRPNGEALDERLVAVVRWRWRRRAPGPVMGGAPTPEAAGTVRLASGRPAAILRTGGVPLAYLPPAELARRFDLFRDALRSLDGGVLLHATSAPIHGAALVPAPTVDGAAERTAAAGYGELIGLIARRRSVRQVYVGLAAAEGGVAGAAELETRVASLADRLAAIGVRTERLRGAGLARASVRMGLAAGGPPP